MKRNKLSIEKKEKITQEDLSKIREISPEMMIKLMIIEKGLKNIANEISKMVAMMIKTMEQSSLFFLICQEYLRSSQSNQS